MLVSQSFSSSGSDKHPRLYKTTKQDNQAISPTEIQKCTDVQYSLQFNNVDVDVLREYHWNKEKVVL